MKEWHKGAVLLLAAIALAAVVYWPAFGAPASPSDEGTTLVYPELLMKGRLPYRDFDTIYGPGNNFILAGAYALFGTSIVVERGVGFLYGLLMMTAAFRIAQRWSATVAVACALVFATLPSGQVWANAWNGGVAFGLCALWALADTKSISRCAIGGLLAGLSFLCRCDLAIALSAAVLPLFIAMTPRNRLWFLGAGFVAILPLLVIGAIAGPIKVARTLFFFPTFGLGPASHLPMAKADPLVRRMFYLYIAAATANLAAGALQLWRERSSRGPLLLGVALFGIGCIHYPLWRFDSNHVCNAAILALMFAPLSASVLVTGALPRISPAIIQGAAAIAVLLAIHLCLPAYTAYFSRTIAIAFGRAQGEKAFPVTRHGRSFPLKTALLADATSQLLAELDRKAVPGQRLFVGPGDMRRTNYCDSYIYYLMPDLTPATFFIEMNANSANAPDSRLAQDVASADWVILNRIYDYWFEPNDSSQFGPDAPNNVVREQFEGVAEIGPYLLYRHKSRQD